MSMDMHVFLRRGELPTVQTWKRAVDAAGYPIEVDAGFDPAANTGYVPCRLRGSPSGFEYRLEPADDIVATYPDIAGAVAKYDSVATFSWGSRLDECAVAMILAAILTQETNGSLYDPQEATTYDGGGAMKYADDTYQQILPLL